MSGLLTKPAVTVWSAADPTAPFTAADVSAEADAATARRPVDPDGTGPARVVGHTVVPGRDGTLTAIAVLDLEGGARTVARCLDGRIAALLAEGDHVGHRVAVTAPGEFRPGGV